MTLRHHKTVTKSKFSFYELFFLYIILYLKFISLHFPNNQHEKKLKNFTNQQPQRVDASE